MQHNKMNYLMKQNVKNICRENMIVLVGYIGLYRLYIKQGKEPKEALTDVLMVMLDENKI